MFRLDSDRSRAEPVRMPRPIKSIAAQTRHPIRMAERPASAAYWRCLVTTMMSTNRCCLILAAYAVHPCQVNALSNVFYCCVCVCVYVFMWVCGCVGVCLCLWCVRMLVRIPMCCVCARVYLCVCTRIFMSVYFHDIRTCVCTLFRVLHRRH